MGFWSAIGSFVGSVCSAISSTVSSLGISLSTFAAKIVELAGPLLETVGKIASMVAKFLGVTEGLEDPIELGLRAEMSDKKPEDFDNYKDYINYIKNEVKIDKEKLKNASDIDKAKYSAIGSGILIKGIEDKKDMDIGADVFVALAKIGMETLDKMGGARGVDAILDTFKDGKLSEFAKYVSGDLNSVKDKIMVSDKLTETFKNLNPEMDIKDIQKEVMDMGNKK